MGNVVEIERDDIQNLPTFRAAYSNRTALLMAKLAGRIYDPISDAASYGVFERFFDGLGLKVERLEDEPTGTAGALFSNDELIVIAFRGTEDLRDWATNFRMGWNDPPLQGGVRVHRGFFKAYQPVRDALFRTLLPLIRQKQRPVYITGHSLGGALALMAAAELANHDEALVRDSIAACYTFGCPKAGDRLFDQYVKVPLYRVTNGVDIVPALPPLLSGYRHVGDTRYFGSRGASPLRRAPNYVRQLWLSGLGLAAFVWSQRLQNVADHKMDTYIDKLHAWIEAEATADLERRRRTADRTL